MMTALFLNLQSNVNGTDKDQKFYAVILLHRPPNHSFFVIEGKWFIRIKRTVLIHLSAPFITPLEKVNLSVPVGNALY